MARLKAIRSFTDASTGKLIVAGREFDCAQSTASSLVKQGLAAPVQAAKPAAKKPRRRS